MCGLVGIFDLRGERPVETRLLDAMTDILMHRGPDGRGTFTAPGVGLGHRRLSIIDLGGSPQPFLSTDERIAIVFNGEIYNFQALRAELQAAGHRFRSDGDTEVIIEAWRAWGPDCVSRLRGMFAFALWDKETRQLFIARDRLGKKPLYYAELADGQLIFGSELKALTLHPGLDRRMDATAVADYLAYNYVPEPKSIYESVRKLPPAHAMLVERGKPLSPRAYWTLKPAKDAPRRLEEAVESFNHLFAEATRLRMVSDVPLGAFLSGGVDSSGIVATMAGLSDQPVNTFSIAFGDKAFDESEYAQAVAERYHTNHTRFEVEPDEFDLVDRLAGIYDEPYGDSSALPTLRVCSLARQKVTVALSGDGGDEMFAGYRRYVWHQREEQLKGMMPRALRQPLFGFLGTVYPKLDWAPRFLRAKTTFQELALDETEAYFLSVSVMRDSMRQRILSDTFQKDTADYHPKDILGAALAEAESDSPLTRAQYADIKTWLPGDILVKVDRASMAASLEVRAPLLDHEVAEWALGLPDDLRLHGGEKKYLLKKAFEPLLPHDLLYRPKQGFSMPIASWFRGPLKERMMSALTSARLDDSGIFDMGALKTLGEEHAGGRFDHSPTIWTLLMFESFLRQETGTAAPQAVPSTSLEMATRTSSRPA